MASGDTALDHWDFQACHGSNFFDTFSVQSKLTEWKDTHTIRVDQISQSDQASDACDRGLDFTFCRKKLSLELSGQERAGKEFG